MEPAVAVQAEPNMAPQLKLTISQDFGDEPDFAPDLDGGSARADKDHRLPMMENLLGRYSLESSGTERYDLYIDRAAAHAKAQERAQMAPHVKVSLRSSCIGYSVNQRSDL